MIVRPTVLCMASEACAGDTTNTIAVAREHDSAAVSFNGTVLRTLDVAGVFSSGAVSENTRDGRWGATSPNC